MQKIIGPIQRSIKDAIGVIALTDVDLFTKRCGNYAFGIASPQDGGIQSIHRLMPEWTGEDFKGEELESWIL